MGSGGPLEGPRAWLPSHHPPPCLAAQGSELGISGWTRGAAGPGPDQATWGEKAASCQPLPSLLGSCAGEFSWPTAGDSGFDGKP